MPDTCPLCGRQMHLRWNAGQIVWWCDTPHYSTRADTGTACQPHGAMGKPKEAGDDK